MLMPNLTLSSIVLQRRFDFCEAAQSKQNPLHFTAARQAPRLPEPPTCDNHKLYDTYDFLRLRLLFTKSNTTTIPAQQPHNPIASASSIHQREPWPWRLLILSLSAWR